MYKIYTPNEWYTTFGCASLIIEDDGFIYNGEDYNGIMPVPIGKIDYAKGLIFDKSYQDYMPRAIGSIEDKGDVKVIYGEDFREIMPKPLLYIQNNRIYTAEEFYSITPSVSGYVSGGNNSVQSYTSSSSTYSSSTSSAGSSGTSSKSGSYEGDVEEGPIAKFFGAIFDLGFWGIIGVIFGLVIIAFMLYIPFHVMGGGEGAEYAQLLITALGFGAIIAFFMAQDVVEMFVRMLMWSMIGVFVLDVFNTYQNGNFTTGGLILTLIFGVILYGLVLLVPCAVLSFCLWQIKKLFIKKESVEAKDSEKEKKKQWKKMSQEEKKKAFAKVLEESQKGEKTE